MLIVHGGLECEIEITNFNLRVRPVGSDPTTFTVAMNFVCADHAVAVAKALCADKEKLYPAISIMRKAVKSLGFKYDWKSKRKDFGMARKQKIHNPADGKTDADHMAGVKHALEQMGYTVTPNGQAHYGAKNIRVSEKPTGNKGEVEFSLHAIRFELDPNAPAADAPPLPSQGGPAA